MDQQKCFYFNNETLSANKTPLLPDKVSLFNHFAGQTIIFVFFLIPSLFSATEPSVHL